MSEPRSRPAFLRYLWVEVLLLTVAGSIYGWKVTHPNRAEPVPITPIAVSDRSALASDSRLTPPRSVPVELAATPQSAGLALTTGHSYVKDEARGARYSLDATFANTGSKSVRQLRLVLECLSRDGERIGVDSFEALGPQQPPLKPGAQHHFILTSDIDPRTTHVRLVAQVRDDGA